MFEVIPVPGAEKLIRDTETLAKLIVHDGKTTPVKEYLRNSPFKWVTQPNSTAPIQLAHTGKSNIIAIDFDGPEGDKNFHKAIQLDPDCKYIAKGVGKGGGHMIYTADNADTLRALLPSNNGCKISGLDVQMGEKLIFLATPENETKELLTEPTNALTDMPEIMQLFVGSLYLKATRNDTIQTQGISSSAHQDSKLYYIVKEAIDNPTEYNHKFFSIVTTKEYKAKLTQKHLDYKYIPDNLPMDESGNAYLVSIATILGRDPSIDSDTFKAAMNYTNSLFSQPMPQRQVDSICSYITSGGSRINGEPVWQYNQDWQKTGLTYTDNDGASHEVFMYVTKGSYEFINHNHITNELEYFSTTSALIDTIKATTTRFTINKDKLLQRIVKVKLIDTPLKPFGIARGEYGASFNIYRRTEEQDIFMEPSIHKEHYKEPTVTLKFLENSMGYNKLYNFFLPFMKRKLKTREFSPLIMVLYGPPHSGKSAVTNGILRPLTKGRNQTLSIETATEKYDTWKLNKDIILIDEIHNTRSDYLQKLIQTMNTISGSSILTGLRAMQTVASSEEHDNTITIFVTCNKTVTLSTEAQDRRLVIMRSRNKVSAALGMSDPDIETAIRNESKDFAYYLATQVQLLEHSRYVSNDWLKDKDYLEFQESALPFKTALCASIDKQDFDTFESLMLDHSLSLTDIARSSHDVKDTIQIRLHNSDEKEAHYPALLNALNIDHKAILRELNEIGNTQVRRVDTLNGDRRTNKKSVAIFQKSNLPEKFLEMVETLHLVHTDERIIDLN